MVRAFVLFEGDLDEARYRQHVEEYADKVSASAFRNGKVFGAPLGEPRFTHYAEFEWADMDSFKQATKDPAFMAAGKDAMDMGVPFTVHFAQLSE